jgi:hypothetical protein
LSRAVTDLSNNANSYKYPKQLLKKQKLRLQIANPAKSDEYRNIPIGVMGRIPQDVAKTRSSREFACSL